MKRPGLIYLAGPITAVGQEESRKWRQEAAAKLEGAGFLAFDPAGAFTVPEGLLADACTITYIQEINNLAISKSQCLLARFIAGVKSIGTEEEIILAGQLGVPIVIYHENEKQCSTTAIAVEWLQRLLSPRQITGVSIFTGINAAIEHITIRGGFP